MTEVFLMDERLSRLLSNAYGTPIADAAGWLRRADEYAALIERCMLGSAPVDHAVRGDVMGPRNRKLTADGKRNAV